MKGVVSRRLLPLAAALLVLSCAEGPAQRGGSDAQTACTPQCSGKQCGEDGCGGICGSCAATEQCSSAGLCTCAPKCSSTYICGDDGCGGSCGNCNTGFVCSRQGTCVDASTCKPDCVGRVCGPDNCGGVCKPNSCAANETCDAAGTCVCVPSCQGKVCGSDGCGGVCKPNSCGAGSCKAGKCVYPDAGLPADKGSPDVVGAKDTGGTLDGASADVGGTGTLPPVGNPNAEATCSVPSGAGLESSSKPTTVVGTGTPASCTSAAFVAAVAKGGVITFNCGSKPATITLNATAKIFNDKGPKIVIDGKGLITLSGGGKHRILYMNTCDQAQKWTTSHCNNQDHPQLTVQNLTFTQGNSKSEKTYDGGGAIWARGGRLKLVNTRFFSNVCADTGPDLGGAAVRALSQYNNLPVYVVNSTFGGKQGLGGVCSNGGGISSIGVSWTIINSLFSYNQAIGKGGNPAQSGTPGGGSGGAIYNDGNTMTLSLCGTRIEYNKVNAHGSAIFFVSNNHTGDIKIDKCVITKNIGGSWYPTYPQISNHSDTPIKVTSSTIK